MRFVKITLEYLKKSFWLLALIALVPAVLLAIFLKPVNMLTFLPLYFDKPVGNFGDVFWELIDQNGFRLLHPYFLLAIMMLVYYSIALAAIEKHMRTGKIGTQLLSALNNNIISTLISLALFMLVFLIAMILQSSIITLLHFLVSGGERANVFDCIYVTIWSLALFLLFVRAVMNIIMWGPVMQIYGYSFKDAVVETSHISYKKNLSLSVGVMIPHLIAAAICIIVFLLPFSGITRKLVTLITDILVYIALLVYVPSYIMCSLFTITGLERRDNKKY